DLDRGRFVALGPALSRRPLPVTIGAVETSARSGSPRLLPLPEQPPEDAHELIFTPAEPEPVRPPPRRPVAPPPPSTNDILAQLVRARPEPPAPSEPAEPPLPAAERDALLDAVLAGARAGPRSAFRSLAVRCRIRRVPGAPPDLPAFRRRLAMARAGIDAQSAAEEGPWHAAVSLAATLPEDMHGVFLMLARAAHDGAPCPSDAAVARAYGTH